MYAIELPGIRAARRVFLKGFRRLLQEIYQLYLPNPRLLVLFFGLKNQHKEFVSRRRATSARHHKKDMSGENKIRILLIIFTASSVVGLGDIAKV